MKTRKLVAPSTFNRLVQNAVEYSFDKTLQHKGNNAFERRKTDHFLKEGKWEYIPRWGRGQEIDGTFLQLKGASLPFSAWGQERHFRHPNKYNCGPIKLHQRLKMSSLQFTLPFRSNWNWWPRHSLANILEYRRRDVHSPSYITHCSHFWLVQP